MELSQVIAARRSYRSLKAVAVSDEMVGRLAAAASQAPSCRNNQPWRFVFVRDPEKLRALGQSFSPGNDWARGSSMVIAVVSKKEMDCELEGRQYFLFDTGMAVALLLLQATEMGLVAHVFAGYDEESAKRILNIPAAMTLIALIAVGEHLLPPAELLSKKQKEIEEVKPPRLPQAEIERREAYE